MSYLRQYEVFVSALADHCVLFEGPMVHIEGTSVRDALERSFPSYEFTRNPSKEDFPPECIFYTVGPTGCPYGAKKTFWWGAKEKVAR